MLPTLILTAAFLQATPDRVYTVDPEVDGTVIVLSGLVTGFAYGVGDRFVHTRCPCDTAEVNAFDQVAIGLHNELAYDAATALAALAFAAPLVIDLSALGFSTAFKEDATVYIETLTINAALVTVMKYAVQRPFPRTYSGDFPKLERTADGYRSFYSGHTAFTAAALTAGAFTRSLRHGPSPLLWLFVAGATVAVGLGTVASGWHFPTDVATGAAVGLFSGLVIPALHARPQTGLSLAPTPGGLGLALSF